MQKVVITGATGVIGRALIDYLLDKDIQILAIVRKDSKRASSLPSNKNLKILECNLENLKNIEINEQYDVFFHLAWGGTFGESRNDLYSQILNIQYTLDAVNLANKMKCKTFIGAGSQAEYGRVDGTILETTNTNPENGYGIEN